MKKYPVILLLLICTLHITSQISPVDYYDQGNIALQYRQYTLADSLFTISLQKAKHPDTYFNRAASRLKMGDKAGYCMDLFEASRLADKEAGSVFWKDCAMRDTSYRHRKDEIKINITALYKEVVQFNARKESGVHLCYDLNNALTGEYENVNADTIYSKATTEPHYPGGTKAMNEYLRKTMVYPAYARRERITGAVQVEFVVGTDGSVHNTTLLKGIDRCEACNHEVINRINQLPKWSPATYMGKPVNFRFRHTVNFIR